MDIQRLILFVVFAFSVMLLWQRWEEGHQPPPQALRSAPAQGGPALAPGSVGAIPSGVDDKAAPAATGAVPGSAAPAAAVLKPVRVHTDLVDAEIDLQGGTLSRLDLLGQKDPEDPSLPLTLMGPKHHYSLQSGFTGEGLPSHRSLYHSAQPAYALAAGEDSVTVRLETDPAGGVRAVKTLTFHRGSYLIDITQTLVNESGAPIGTSAYFLLTRDNVAPGGEARFGAQTYTGAAFFTEATKYRKVSWSDYDKNKKDVPDSLVDNGWTAMIQHYFVSALLPREGAERRIFADKADEQVYRMGYTLPVAAVAPGANAQTAIRLYAGPQEQSTLKALAPGLDLVVDYGWLAIIAVPLFWLLQTLHSGLSVGGVAIPGTQNWGWSIILLTVLIKAVFFPLSAASYRSMAKMKQVAPKLNRLKEQYGEDRMKLNQAMMELYKTEKINPLGGCLPVVIQIPVFLALYWTLLGAVELRQAPFMWWIHDLALPDPLYILPVLMLGSMVLQTRLSPTPPDPVQAKVMMFMPFVFGIMFFWFPSGLVLYWFVNNLLSIAQQWQITRMVSGGKAGAKPAA